MRLSQLKRLSSSEARNAYLVGRISRFEMNFSNYLRGEIDWPKYKPEEVAAIREKLGLTQEGLALLLRVSPKTILRWETEEGVIPTTGVIALCTLEKLRGDVFGLMDEDSGQLMLVQENVKPEDAPRPLKDSRVSPQKRRPPDAFGRKEIKTLQARFNISRPAFAELLGVSLSTVDKWESGSVTPKGPSLTILKLLWTHGPEVLF